MTSDSARRLEIARLAAAVYAAHRDVAMVTVTGSVASGEADRWSDVDLGVYWDRVVDDAWLAEPRIGAPARRLGLSRCPEGAAELYDHEGITVEVAHALLGCWDPLVDAVLVHGRLAPEDLFPLDGVIKQLVLVGDDHLAAARRRLEPMPPAVRDALLERYLAFPWLVQLTKAAQRGDSLLYQDLLVEAVTKALVVLGALNGRYLTTMWPRRTATVLRTMAITPDRTAERIARILAGDRGMRAVGELEQLLTETVGLVEQHAPDVDVTVARRRLRRRAGG